MSGGFDVFGYAAWRDYLLVNMPAREMLAAGVPLPPAEPWPPEVTLAAPPCWRCITGPPLVSPLARYLLENR